MLSFLTALPLWGRILTWGVSAAALVAMTAGVYGAWHHKVYTEGRAVERARCDSRELAANEAASRRDIEQSAVADDDAAQRTTEMQRLDTMAREAINAYEALLHSRPNNFCPLTPSDISKSK